MAAGSLHANYLLTKKEMFIAKQAPHRQLRASFINNMVRELVMVGLKEGRLVF